MKTFKSFLAALLLCVFALNARATFFFVQLFQSDGAINQSQIGVSVWPPTDQPFVTYGTNMVYNGNLETVVLNSSGYGTNWLFPGTYRFYITNLNAAFIAVIPDTLLTNSISLYVTNLPVFPGVSLNSYGTMTNLLGFAPATNTFKGMTNAMGYMPATNSNSGIVFALGFTPATNNYNGITNSLGFAPATNSFIGATNQLGFAPATNSNSGITSALGFTPPTNNYTGTTNSLGFAPATNSFIGATNQLGYTPATNGTAGIEAGLGFVPATNNGYIGQGTAVGWIATNGIQVWVCYKTNNLPGPAFTNLPVGSLMTTTNGGFYSLSNLVWQSH